MSTVSSITINQEHLRAAARAIVKATGSDDAEATIVADHLVEANLRGHDSHGVGMLPLYVQNFHAGKLKPNQHARLLREDGAIAVFSGEMGYGQKIAREVMDWAIERARKSGVAVVALRDVQHIARVGSYGEQAAEAGMIAMLFVNALSGHPFVAAFGGTDGGFRRIRFALRSPARIPRHRSSSILRRARLRWARYASRTTRVNKSRRDC